MTKRIFIATFIDRTIFEYVLPELQEDFRSSIIGKWVEIENLHFTYKFLGDVEIKKINEIKAELNPYFKEYDFPLKFQGINCFPNQKQPQILYIQAKDTNNNLLKINTEIENCLLAHGFPKEKKSFKPHITLNRIKQFNNIDFIKQIDNYSNYEFGYMEKFKVNLVESKLTNRGPLYNII